MSSQVFTAFQGGQGAALAAVVTFAVLSFIAIDFVWLRVVVVAVNQLLGKGSLQTIKRERAIFHSQLGAYMASLLFSNLLSSISFIVNATWVSQGGVTSGALCSSQATLSQIADVATAYFTGAIAVHSFTSLVLKFRLPLWSILIFVLGGWAIAIILAVFPIHTQTTLGPFYAIDGLTCGISPEYPLFKTFIHLIPIFVASLVAAIFYALVFLILRGTIGIGSGIRLNLDYESRRSTMHDSHEYPKFIAAIARSMLWYPVAYVALMFPHLITCLLHASGFKVSEVLRIITACASAMLGLANVLIFYNTIRIMGPAFDGTGSQNSEKPDSEKSFVGISSSPVDVAPPVAAILAPTRAFPPPRNLASKLSVDTISTAHSRQTSSTSVMSGDSTRGLLPAAQLRQARSDNPYASDIGRPISSVSKLNAMITSHASEKPIPRLTVNVPAENTYSLPTPRRDGRTPIVGRPMPSPTQPSAMIPVPLSGNKYPTSADSTYSSRRNSFINMYMPSKDQEVPAMPTFAFGSSPGYSSASPSASDVEESNMTAPVPAAIPRPNKLKPKGLKSELMIRLSTVEYPEEDGGLSSMALASLVGNAATIDGGVRSASTSTFAPSENGKVGDVKGKGKQRELLKALRRRSRSMDNLSIPAPQRFPSLLRPDASSNSTRSAGPASARLPSAGPMRALPGIPKSAAASKFDKRGAASRDVPSKTPTYGRF
ncbi:hypothetical protein BC835DRAFT_1410537 [Cytidiella melzeri]|nr:hypothetical protein BC835DRAFT_1410537 [Cytidiella melzeri]